MLFLEKIKGFLNQDYVKLEEKNYKKDIKDIRDIKNLRESNIMLSQRL